jgi:hypothetical protein
VIQPRPLVPARDTCSRPTPHRIVQRIAGMAFNFSNVQLPGLPGPLPDLPFRRDGHRNHIRHRRLQRESSSSQQHVFLL